LKEGSSELDARDRLEGETDQQWGYRLGCEDTEERLWAREAARLREERRNMPPAEPWTYEPTTRHGTKARTLIPCCAEPILLDLPTVPVDHCGDELQAEGLAVCRRCRVVFNYLLVSEPADDDPADVTSFWGVKFQKVGPAALSSVTRRRRGPAALLGRL
jgi:hypothetical protein